MQAESISQSVNQSLDQKIHDNWTRRYFTSNPPPFPHPREDPSCTGVVAHCIIEQKRLICNMRFLMQRSVFEQLRYFSHLFYLGNAISDADYKTLVSLCIAIILLFSAWLVILVEVLIYSCRHHLRKNRFV